MLSSIFLCFYQCFVGKPDDILGPNLGGLLEEVGKTTVTKKFWLVKSDILPWRVPFGKRKINMENHHFTSIWTWILVWGNTFWIKVVGHWTNLIQIFDQDPHGLWVPASFWSIPHPHVCRIVNYCNSQKDWIHRVSRRSEHIWYQSTNFTYIYLI